MLYFSVEQHCTKRNDAACIDSTKQSNTAAALKFRSYRLSMSVLTASPGQKKWKLKATGMVQVSLLRSHCLLREVKTCLNRLKETFQTKVKVRICSFQA